MLMINIYFLNATVQFGRTVMELQLSRIDVQRNHQRFLCSLLVLLYREARLTFNEDQAFLEAYKSSKEQKTSELSPVNPLTAKLTTLLSQPFKSRKVRTAEMLSTSGIAELIKCISQFNDREKCWTDVTIKWTRLYISEALYGSGREGRPSPNGSRAAVVP